MAGKTKRLWKRGFSKLKGTVFDWKEVTGIEEESGAVEIYCVRMRSE